MDWFVSDWKECFLNVILQMRSQMISEILKGLSQSINLIINFILSKFVMSHRQYTTLIHNRNNLTARGSIEAITNYAREQDSKLLNAKRRVARAHLLLKVLLVAPPVVYAFWHLTAGSWRKIYPTSFMSSFLEVPQQRLREYFVPEIYLKEREKRKIQIKLKETEELREIWHK